MTWKVYFIESIKNGKYYIGVTSDLNRRLHEHNNEKSKSTKFWCPWKLRRVEEFKDIKEAYKRESFLKSKKSKKIVKKIIESG